MMPAEYMRYAALLETSCRMRRDKTEKIILRWHKVVEACMCEHLLKKCCKSVLTVRLIRLPRKGLAAPLLAQRVLVSHENLFKLSVSRKC